MWLEAPFHQELLSLLIYLFPLGDGWGVFVCFQGIWFTPGIWISDCSWGKTQLPALIMSCCCTVVGPGSGGNERYHKVCRRFVGRNSQGGEFWPNLVLFTAGMLQRSRGSFRRSWSPSWSTWTSRGTTRPSSSRPTSPDTWACWRAWSPWVISSF